MKVNKFTVSGFNSPDEIAYIEGDIHAHDGVKAVRLDMQASTITVDYDDKKCSEWDVRDFVTHAGLNIVNIK